MGDSMKRGKDPLPFYQLPAHMKPCSKIIKEAKVQLKYSGKLGSDWDALVQEQQEQREGPTDFELRMGVGTGAVKAVHTQRPFTPRDTNLWGPSARKRPPSAITLTRLSLDDIDEQRPMSKTRVRSGKAPPLPGQMSLDKLDNLSPISPTGNEMGSPNEADMDKIRMRFKAMSVKNGKSSPQLTSPNSEIRDVDPIGLVNNVNLLSKKVRNGNAGQTTTMSRNNAKNRASQPKSISDPKFEPYQTINSLEVAIEYLKSFLETTEKVPKTELIALLKRIKYIVSQGPAEDILKCRLIKLLFKLVEKNCNDEDLLFWSSFILLHCQIIGNNLTTVFKMVFKASRSPEYAEIIRETEYLDVFMSSLGQICPLTQTESMIYGYGTLKFICTTAETLLQALDLNLISVMSLHLNILNLEIGTSRPVSESIQNGVFQLTSILRSVVGIEASLPDVVNNGLLDEVCSAIAWAVDDIDVLSNIVRILSVVSCHDRCLEMLAHNERLPASIVKVQKTWYSKSEIVVRINYCLGNLLAHDEGMRVKMYHEPLAYEVVIKLMVHHMANSTDGSEDVLVKTLRILANWTLNRTIGAEISEDPTLSEILNCILKGQNVSNELLMCAISTLNNITYYKSQLNCDLDAMNINTGDCLYGYLTLKNIDARTETMKVLGNLTRNETVRAAACKHIGALLISLDESNEELLCATIGVLMNTIVDDRTRTEFLRRGGLEYLMKVMQNKGELGLNLMMYQFLWNLIIAGLHHGPDGKERCALMTQTQIQDLANMVSNKITAVRNIQKKLEKGSQELTHYSMTSSDLANTCKDFLSVAANLQEKLFELV